MKKLFLASVIASLTWSLISCSVLYYNTDEYTVDTNWATGNYDVAAVVASEDALKGKAWAQLRLAMYYQYYARPLNIELAIKWYKRAAQQFNFKSRIKAGNLGRKEYAMVAQYQLANIYLHGIEGAQKNYIISYLLLKNILAHADEKTRIVHCCSKNGKQVLDKQKFLSLEEDFYRLLPATQVITIEKEAASLSLYDLLKPSGE